MPTIEVTLRAVVAAPPIRCPERELHRASRVLSLCVAGQRSNPLAYFGGGEANEKTMTESAHRPSCSTRRMGGGTPSRIVNTVQPYGRKPTAPSRTIAGNVETRKFFFFFLGTTHSRVHGHRVLHLN